MAKDNLAKNTILLSIGTFLNKGLTLLLIPIFSRWLSTEDYGTFDVICTYVSLFLPVVGLATNEALFRFSMDVNTAEEKKKFVSNCLSVFVINSAIVLIGIIAFSRFFQWDLGIYFFVLLAGEVFNLHLRGYLRAIKHLDIYSFTSAIATVCTAIFVTIFVWVLNFGLKGMILGYGLGYIFGNLVIVVWTRYWKYLDIKTISVHNMFELIKYSYVLVPNSLSWWLINVSDRTLIRIFLGPAANGIYAISCKIPSILTSVFGVFSVSWQQSATEAVNNIERDKYYNQIYNKMISVLFPLCCGVLSLNSWLFNYVFDPKYKEAYLYAPILLGGTVFATMSQFYGGIQISLKQPKENGISTVIGAIVNVLIDLILIRYIGLYAAAISTFVSQLTVCLIRNARLKKDVKLVINRSSIKYLLIYIAFTASAYYISNMVFNCITVLIATFVIIASNYSFAKKLIKRLKKHG